ncbi:urease accessory protein UreG [Corynebacterium heidelbergense]|uniref:Urease accessory protein UreG n=1 Tax=Corynebacterium heidelbergense TaxID=2055947 RepID=A0A364V9V1_9CORY|nr:urease accessory protein UreG [Corynebacterium heidelbergense]RAV33432.1 urease accessory protein UreG [Corynebacterium heidelbergense]WCZ36733.1 Urease accessory protein UreG [Corynebacterium heidelbergense]
MSSATTPTPTPQPLRIGIGGPVGSGKTALIEALVPKLVDQGHRVGVITNDIYTQEDANHIRRELADIIPGDHVVGVETGSCPHTAVRDDPTMNLMTAAELLEEHPDIDTLFFESGGDNLTLTFSPALVDVFVFVLDTAEGEKMPRKRGPGITDSDVLVINKVDIAQYVRCDVDRMHSDAQHVRNGKTVVLTNSLDGQGIDQLLSALEAYRTGGDETHP